MVSIENEKRFFKGVMAVTVFTMLLVLGLLLKFGFNSYLFMAEVMGLVELYCLNSVLKNMGGLNQKQRTVANSGAGQGCRIRVFSHFFRKRHMGVKFND